MAEQAPSLITSRCVLTVLETAQRILCSRAQVFIYLKTGELRRGKAAGRETVVTIASIEAFERRHFEADRVAKSPAVSPLLSSREALAETLRQQRLALLKQAREGRRHG